MLYLLLIYKTMQVFFVYPYIYMGTFIFWGYIKFMENIVVRADYYNDGNILPISVTYNGKTYPISKICDIETKIYMNDIQIQFICYLNNKKILLINRKNSWIIDEFNNIE